MAQTITLEEGWRRVRAAGIVGEGGAGFPTYAKYQDPTDVFILNAAESEPGYYADKLMVKREPELYVVAMDTLRRVFGFEELYFAYKEKDEQGYFSGFLDGAADAPEIEPVAVEDEYKMGEERTLTERVTGREVPADGIAKDVGVTMNNVETVWNIHKALTEGRPLTRKVLQTLGEADNRVFEVPIGATPIPILKKANFHTYQVGVHRLISGGPLLGEEVEDFAPDSDWGVSGRTNGLTVVEEETFRLRSKEYPLDHEPPTGIEDLRDAFDRVVLPLDRYPGAPPEPIVQTGDEVRRGDRVAEPPEDELSVSIHASIDGDVGRVEAGRLIEIQD